MTKENPKTVSEGIIKTFLEQLSATKEFEEIADKLGKAILNKKPTEASIRSAIFDEEV